MSATRAPVALKDKLRCPECHGIGLAEAGTALQDCARCGGDGDVKIGDELVTVRLAERLKRFKELGE